MRRRKFIAGLASTLSLPRTVCAEQLGVPVLGYLDTGSLETRRTALDNLHSGLAEAGYVEGRNLAVEYRWANDYYERLPVLAVDLVRRQVAVIVAVATPAAIAAKAETQSIPIVFFVAGDPVKIGLVSSFNRPVGNLTGISVLLTATAAKRLELLHEVVPRATSIAFLVNSANVVGSKAEIEELEVAARTLRMQLITLDARAPSEFDKAFETLARQRVGGLLVGQDPLFNNHVGQLVELATRYAVPTIYWSRDATAAGGLISYGTDIRDPRRQAGFYAGLILKGTKPSNLPVQQVSKIELVINLTTAKRLGIKFPATILVRANEIFD
jgi:putative ABC transport system substrate-binding protein